MLQVGLNGLFHLQFQSLVSVTREWKKMVNKLRRQWSHDFHEASCDSKRLEEQSHATQGKESMHTKYSQGTAKTAKRISAIPP